MSSFFCGRRWCRKRWKFRREIFELYLGLMIKLIKLIPSCWYIEMNPFLVSFGRFPCNLFPRFSYMGFLLQVDRGWDVVALYLSWDLRSRILASCSSPLPPKNHMQKLDLIESWEAFWWLSQSCSFRYSQIFFWGLELWLYTSGLAR